MSRALCASLFAVLSNVEAVIKGKKVIVSLRVLTFSTFEGKKVLVSRVEVDHNGHVDAAEQCLTTSCHLKLSLVESLIVCLAFCRPIQCGGGC